jgi:hypothetical protein
MKKISTAFRPAVRKQGSRPIWAASSFQEAHEPATYHLQGGPASVMNVALSENHPWMPTDGAP